MSDPHELTLSELIYRLSDIKKRFGELPVRVIDEDGRYIIPSDGVRVELAYYAPWGDEHEAYVFIRI